MYQHYPIIIPLSSHQYTRGIQRVSPQQIQPPIEPPHQSSTHLHLPIVHQPGDTTALSEVIRGTKRSMVVKTGRTIAIYKSPNWMVYR